MYMLMRGHRVLALTASRLTELCRLLRQGSGGKPLRLMCWPYLVPDAGLSTVEQGPEQLRSDPQVGLMLFGPARSLDRGPLAYTVFRHRGMEAAFLRTFGALHPLHVSIEELATGRFGVSVSVDDGVMGSGRLIEAFDCEPDEAIDCTWVKPVQDEAFIAQTVDAIAVTTHMALWDRSRQPWMRLPYLDPTNPAAFELAPGMWIALPGRMLSAQREKVVVPALVLDPVRYVWREGFHQDWQLIPQNAYLSADLSFYGDLATWEERIRQIECNPKAAAAFLRILADLCIERGTGRSPTQIDWRPFVWTRYMVF